MKPIDVLIYVDHPVRELDAMTAVGHLLARKGLSWDLVPLRKEEYSILTAYRPTLACFTWFYHEVDRGFERCRRYWPNARFVNLAFEQSVQQINRRLKSPKNPYVLQEVRHSCWSHAYAEDLRGKGVPAHGLKVNGSPVLALYQEPYRRMYPGRAELADAAGLDPAKRWVFIPENYNAAFYDEVKVEEYVRAGEKREDVLAYISWAEESLFRLVEWLADAPPDVEVVLRPRPGVGKPAFLAKLGDRVDRLPASVHITDTMTVREWVLASDAIASNFSTTMIEAGAAGKPVFMLAPVPFPSIVMNDWYGLVEQARDRQEFLAVLSGEREGSPDRLGAWAREGLMPAGDPIEALAAWLFELHGQAAGATTAVSGATRLMREAECGLRAWLKSVRRRRSHIPPQDLFGPEDVALRRRRWAEILG